MITYLTLKVVHEVDASLDDIMDDVLDALDGTLPDYVLGIDVLLPEDFED